MTIKPTQAQPGTPSLPERLVSLDAYRGFIMLAMASSGFHLARVAKEHFPGQPVWEFLAYQSEHVKWTGCSFWDLIQPAFMFMVGVAMPFSYASRRARGESRGRRTAHVFYRSLVLILLGIFLSSNWTSYTNYTFVNVLTQIGLGYCFVFLLLGAHFLLQLLAVLVILGGYWFLFAWYPLPSPTYDWAAFHVTKEERFPDPRADKDGSFKRAQRPASGSGQPQPGRPDLELPPDTYFGAAAHWNKNSNFASDIDNIMLSQLPRANPINEGGYATLNFVPSMATMIFGIMAGELLRRQTTPRRKLLILVLSGIAFLLAGLIVDHYIWPDWLADGIENLRQTAGLGSAPFFERTWTLCPIVKRIWTPSWTVFSTGWTLLMLAAFYWLIDMRGWRRWTFPLIVVGMNSIAMYCMSQLLKPWIRATLKKHLDAPVRSLLNEDAKWGIFDGTYGPILESAAILLVLWLVCLWMYRRKIFIRI
jgi:predicted acyltransferase